MVALMEQMDRELAGTEIGKSFEKEPPPSEGTKVCINIIGPAWAGKLSFGKGCDVCYSAANHLEIEELLQRAIAQHQLMQAIQDGQEKKKGFSVCRFTPTS